MTLAYRESVVKYIGYLLLVYKELLINLLVLSVHGVSNL